MPQFTIVIPTFNRAEMLPATLSSVQMQCFTDWECIVVDDGSTDSSAQIIEQMCKKDGRFRYLHQENSERSAARNVGIRNAKGRYICFLDSDDYFVPEYLETLYQFLKKKDFPVAFVISNFSMWNNNVIIAYNVRPFTPHAAADWFILNPVSPSRACIHAKILESYTFDEALTCAEYTELWIRISAKYPIIHLPKALIWRRVHEGNPRRRTSAACLQQYKVLKKLFASPESNYISNKVKKLALSDVRFRIAEYYAVNGNFMKALIKLVHSICTAPFHRRTKAKSTSF